MKKFFSLFWNYLKKSDTLLLGLCIAATVYGIVLIRTSTAYLSSSNAASVQVLALFIGIALYFVFSLIDIDILADNWKLLFAAGIGLLALLVFAQEEGGNRAWLRFMGIGIQPAEIVKIFFIVIIAKLIVSFSNERRLDHILSLGAMTGILLIYFGMILVLSSDLGSGLVYLFIFIAMLFAGGLKIYWFLIALTGFAIVSPYIWNSFLSDNQKNRIIAVFDPKSVDPTGLGITWQVNQSKAAIASGGIFGQGLGQGQMTQSGSVPKQRTDFIFSAAGEELGFVGCLAIVILLVAIIIRCVYVGYKSQSKLGALISVGVAAMLTFQTFENLGMCLGVAPVVGLTLPFFSSGGSSVVTSFACMGIISGIKMKPKPVMFTRR
ncbi:MAG: FtsW/RodA/SpoVE family cell cycle protein [Oscillospiraceae bacterium]|nr:FtsW/RodA/SpoVE family cell cycle protein [Oscillospiraceae bacterium]MBQ3951914.1 FtsW/RodA/SpoVE family cell cycle protein [Oscillospiraceae bacterium]